MSRITTATSGLVNLSRELAALVGPTVAGLLIAAQGAGSMYVLDAVTYGFLVATLGALKIAPTTPAFRGRIGPEIMDGVRFVKDRPVIWLMMSLDASATIFAAYRVVLPALAAGTLGVGPTGYGLLAATPSAGAILVTYVAIRLVAANRSLGKVVLLATAIYGLSVMALGLCRTLALAVLVCLVVGAADALATSIRQAAVQLETPDELRGRVSAVYQMTARGGPALGNVVVGVAAATFGISTALALGGAVPVICSWLLFLRSTSVRTYTGM